MTPQEFIALVDSVSYKPGYRLRCRHAVGRFNDEFDLELYVQATVPCAQARDGETTAKIASYRLLNPDVISSETRAKEIIRDFLMELEAHEIGEWLLFAGERTFDPHKDEKKLIVDFTVPKGPVIQNLYLDHFKGMFPRGSWWM